METKVTTRKTAVNKISAETRVAAADPFAALAEAVPVKKRVVKKATATRKVEAKPVKKTVSKAAKAITSDPFAQAVDATSPVKKRAAKMVKADTETPKKVVKKAAKKATLDVTAEIAAAVPRVELSASFKALAEPSLPELPRENRARLQMQSPTKLYFYWSSKENPWGLLRTAFGGDTGSYTLVLKLTDLHRDTEEIHQAEAEGDHWFNVEPDGEYQAEIGFYAPNRPYFRIIYSNIVETPRRGPSPRAATDADWSLSANKFAEVLDVAGFSRDAFDVAMAGDDHAAAENVTQTAFLQFIGVGDYTLHGIAAQDIRYAMLALASGVTLDELRGRVSHALFAILQLNAADLEPARAMSALTEYFDIDEAEFTEEQFGPAVFGASLVNFPRTMKTRGMSPKLASRYSPVSSSTGQNHPW